MLDDGHLFAGFAGRDADEVGFEVLAGEAGEEQVGVEGANVVVGDDDGAFGGTVEGEKGAEIG